MLLGRESLSMMYLCLGIGSKPSTMQLFWPGQAASCNLKSLLGQLCIGRFSFFLVYITQILFFRLFFNKICCGAFASQFHGKQKSGLVPDTGMSRHCCRSSIAGGVENLCRVFLARMQDLIVISLPFLVLAVKCTVTVN